MIIFPSKFPIIVSAMNQVSYARFAISCFQEGLMPSISVFNYDRNGNLDYNVLNSELELFKIATNSNTVIVSCSAEHLLDSQFLELTNKFNIKYFELADGIATVDRHVFLKTIKDMQVNGSKFFVKVLNTLSDNLRLFDGIILKGSEGAGRSVESISLEDNFKMAREKYPGLPIIPSGGIYSKEQVDYYLAAGAPAVSIGTLFVASNECRVAISFKQELVEKDSTDLVRMAVGSSSESQQGLKYGFVDDDDENHTLSLNSKVTGNNRGVIFAGHAINHIKQIRPLSEIVNDLVCR